MKASWQCRDYQNGDEYKILNLYQQVNKRQMTLPLWSWKFARVPFGPALIKLMFDGDKLIGHYAITPMRMQIGITTVDAALAANTMTHPDYEKHGIFTYLAEDAYKNCRQQSIRFVYGFPNENAHYGLTRKLGWKDLGRMTILEKDIRSPAQRESRSYHIHHVEKFDERIDLLWKTVRGGYNVTVPRTSVYLNWRFAEHPVEKYAMFVIENDTSGLSGYLILKTYSPPGQEIKGHIVDMLCKDDKALVRDIIRYSEQHFIEKGVNSLSCWASEKSFYSEALGEEGFKRQDFSVYFGVKTFDKGDNTLQNVEQMDNWHLTMANSDVF